MIKKTTLKTTIIAILLIASYGISAFINSSNNHEINKRIAKLEQKISDLEEEKNSLTHITVEKKIEPVLSVTTKTFEMVPAVPKYTTAKENKVPDKVLQFIKNAEVFHSKAYYDSAGELTIGYGFTRFNLKNLKRGDTMSKDEADAFLERLIEEKYAPVIRSTIKVHLTDEQFGSLVSLVHNIGEDAFKKSTLVKVLNQGEIEEASDEFERWTKIDGVSCKGLRQRRLAEKQIFLALYDYDKMTEIYK